MQNGARARCICRSTSCDDVKRIKLNNWHRPATLGARTDEIRLSSSSSSWRTFRVLPIRGIHSHREANQFQASALSNPRQMREPKVWKQAKVQQRYQASYASTSSMADQEQPPQNSDTAKTNRLHRVAIALGSNLGDRVKNIESSIDCLQNRGLRVLRVSSLYESPAMYHLDQGPFLNCACLLETSLAPLDLLDVLQEVETELGRVRGIPKGPRTLDLDILLYDDQVIDHERLQVPHPGILEREFVLRPLQDILDEDYKFPVKSTTTQPVTLAAALRSLDRSSATARPITPIAEHLPLIEGLPQSGQLPVKTIVMAIMNVTPDSFSDGGQLHSASLEHVASLIRRYIEAGASILDIGGQSTRPGADSISAEDELQRILPTLRLIRQMPEARGVAISVDTFHAEVVRRCAEEGLLDIINDVSAGTMDPEMLPLAARLRKTIVLMHMRGTPSTMSSLTDYPHGVRAGMLAELGDRVQAALKVGILPWRMIVDPGIGFSKNTDQNLLSLSSRFGDQIKLHASGGVANLVADKPWLIGVSRKRFIGTITGVKQASDRVFGTAAAVTIAIQHGASIVRVHDVEEMAQVAKLADAVKNVREPEVH